MLFTFRACRPNNMKEDPSIFFPQQYFITRLKVRKFKSKTNWEQQVVSIKEVGAAGWKNKNSVSNLITSPGYRNVERIVAADFRVRPASPFWNASNRGYSAVVSRKINDHCCSTGKSCFWSSVEIINRLKTKC